MKNYKEPSALNAVAQFHELFDAPILETPTIPEQRAQLRVNLLAEELQELQQAIVDGDIVEVADALADLQYVLSGAILEFGLADRFGALFDEVHRSNMSKACNSLEEAEATVGYYQRERGMEGYIVQK